MESEQSIVEEQGSLARLPVPQAPSPAFTGRPDGMRVFLDSTGQTPPRCFSLFRLPALCEHCHPHFSTVIATLPSFISNTLSKCISGPKLINCWFHFKSCCFLMTTKRLLNSINRLFPYDDVWSWLAFLFLLRMDFLEHFWSLQPSHQRSLPFTAVSAWWRNSDLLTWPRFTSMDLGIPLASVFCYEQWLNEWKEKKKEVPMLGLGKLLSFLMSSLCLDDFFTSPTSHLYLSCHSSWLCSLLPPWCYSVSYMHAHTHTHTQQISYCLEYELALRNQNFTVLKGSSLCRWAPLMLSTSVLSSLSAGSSLGPA